LQKPCIVVALEPFSRPGDVAGRLGAVLIFIGGLTTAAISFSSVTGSRESARRLDQQHEQDARRLARQHGDEEARLRIDAATHASALFSSVSGPVYLARPTLRL